MLEREIERKVVAYCKAQSVLCYKFVSPGRRGVPDRLLIFLNRRVVFVELKKKKGGVLAALQVYEQKKLTDQGATVKNFWSYEEFRDWASQQ